MKETTSITVPDSTKIIIYPCWLIRKKLTTTLNIIVAVFNNPTFKGCNRRIEVNIAEFKGDLYDKLIAVEFIAKLRDEVKFDGVDQLVKQIKKDKEKAKQFWRY